MTTIGTVDDMGRIRGRVAAALDRIFREEGIALDADSVAGALLTAAGTSTAPLSESEQNFLDEHAGLTRADPEQAVVEASLMSVASGPEAPLTTVDVAALLGQTKPTVTRARERGDLYAVASGGQLWFPAWQFVPEGAAPGLRVALAALPAHWGQARLARFMTTADDYLDGLSPIDWLAQRSDPARVAQLVVAESHE